MIVTRRDEFAAVTVTVWTLIGQDGRRYTSVVMPGARAWTLA